MKLFTRLAICGLSAAAALVFSVAALAHGDVTPQAVDTKDLPGLGEKCLFLSYNSH